MEKTIKLSISDFSCPPQFQDAYIQEICEKENVKVVGLYRYEEKVPCFPGYFKGTIVYLKGKI